MKLLLAAASAPVAFVGILGMGTVGMMTPPSTEASADGASRDCGREGTPRGSLSKRDMTELWLEAGGKPRLANVMGAVGMAESHGNRKAVGVRTSHGRARGWAQIMWPLHARRFRGMDPHDPEDNAEMAVAIYKSQGLAAWEAYTDGSYRDYMDDRALPICRAKLATAGAAIQGGDAVMGSPSGRKNIVAVPDFPGERANRAILDEIAFYTTQFDIDLTDAYGSGHKSPGHTVYGTASDFSGRDSDMDLAAAHMVESGFSQVLYDGRFGTTRWPGHGPRRVAGDNAHIHVEFMDLP